MNECLSSLSDSELIERLTRLVRNEREATESVVRHLAAVETRRVYARLGFSSLFNYVTKGLGYSASAAMRRIRAARAGAKVPEVFECLERGEMTLSTVEVFAGLIEKHDAVPLLEEFRGKSREEVEEIAAYLQPVPPSAMRDRIKPVVVGTPIDNQQGALTFESKGEENSNYFRSVVEPEVEKRYQISFTADDDFMKLLQRAKELLFRGEKGDVALENVLGRALAAFVERNCPKAREERRQVRKERRKRKTEVTEVLSAEGVPSPEGVVTEAIAVPGEPERTMKTISIRQSSEGSRYIPAALRDAVLARDEHQCTYVGSLGRRCGSCWNLEVDHVIAFACGGPTEYENLRTLCAVHNAEAARETFGAAYIDRRIAKRRHQQI